jgi:hypothetical protein
MRQAIAPFCGPLSNSPALSISQTEVFPVEEMQQVFNGFLVSRLSRL